METREQELERLIKEQRKDDTQLQQPERGTVPLGLLGDYVDVEGLTARRPRKRGGPWDSESCPLHGMSAMKRYPSESERPRCAQCVRDQQRIANKTSGRKREANAKARAKKREAQRELEWARSVCGDTCRRSKTEHPWHQHEYV